MLEVESLSIAETGKLKRLVSTLLAQECAQEQLLENKEE
jgi:hypothetical protein